MRASIFIKKDFWQVIGINYLTYQISHAITTTISYLVFHTSPNIIIVTDHLTEQALSVMTYQSYNFYNYLIYQFYSSSSYILIFFHNDIKSWCGLYLSTVKNQAIKD